MASSASTASFFYVPVPFHWGGKGRDDVAAILSHIRTAWPFFNRSLESHHPNHLLLFTGDLAMDLPNAQPQRRADEERRVLCVCHSGCAIALPCCANGSGTQADAGTRRGSCTQARACWSYEGYWKKPGSGGSMVWFPRLQGGAALACRLAMAPAHRRLAIKQLATLLLGLLVWTGLRRRHRSPRGQRSPRASVALPTGLH